MTFKTYNIITNIIQVRMLRTFKHQSLKNLAYYNILTKKLSIKLLLGKLSSKQHLGVNSFPIN